MRRSEKGGIVAGVRVERVERLDHLGIVAGICREIGLAEYLDALAGPSQQQVSVGTATMALILNGLGCSKRQLYLVSQFFATKPVEHLLGPGITAEQFHDDCLGRTLEWLYAHDPTALFAGVARQARQRFGIAARQVHVDTTSLAVTGEYVADEEEAQTLAYGYSRDHRADLKQWMLALATTRQGDVPLFCQALDGNASDKVSLVAAVEALAEQLCAADEEAPIFVADSGLYSAANVARLAGAGVRWISRVPDTSADARAALAVAHAAWQQDGDLSWASVAQTPAGERWVVVRTAQGEERARKTLERHVDTTRAPWEQALWHLGNQRFACVPDARAALAKQLKTCPAWLQVESVLVMPPKYRRPGRPRKHAPPDQVEWQVLTTLAVDAAAVAREARGKAAFVVATNVLDSAQLSDHELIRIYKEQHSVERGFSFLKDPLFLASSVFVKKPERIVALSLVMVLTRLSLGGAPPARATGRHRPDRPQPTQPTDRSPNHALDLPVLRRRESGDLPAASGPPPQGPPHRELANLEPLHEQVSALLGPDCQKLYKSPD
jgi:transposase